MDALVLRNRWEMFTNEEDEEVKSVIVEEEEDAKPTIVEKDVKSTIVEEESDGVWIGVRRRGRRRRGRRRRSLNELPRDVLFLIFTKLGPIEILRTAQSVCSTWRNLSKEPSLFRSFHVPDLWGDRKFFKFNTCTIFDFDRWERIYYVKKRKLVMEAVDRSCGQMVEFSIHGFVTDDLLHYVFRNLPFLEHLELITSWFSNEVIHELGRSCPQLKYLRLNRGGYCDIDAFVIAENCPHLPRLCLSVNCLTNKGLQAVLDSCPYLDHLDIHQDYLNYRERMEVSPDDYEYYVKHECNYYSYNDDDYDIDDDDDDNLIFLPPKAATCYL